MRKSKKAKAPKKKKPGDFSPENALSFHANLASVQKQFTKLSEDLQKYDERIQDMEIHVNLLTRLLTTLCVEKLGMRIGVLKRLIKRIEKEAIRDSQILHLETLYKMSQPSDKKGPSAFPFSKDDPWEEIS